jgi:ABC-2 type transport system permease protein
MKAWKIFLKTLREMLRDKWALGLTLIFAPFFVFLYWIILSGGSTSYTVLVINRDAGRAGEEIVAAIGDITYADGNPLLKAKLISDRAEAEQILKDRGAAAFLLIPEEFSQTLQQMKGGDRSVAPQITFGGDLSNPYYSVAVSLALTAVDGYVQEVTGQPPLIGYVEEPLGGSGARSEFETYVPASLIFAVIMLIFLASMSIAREIETGTLKRMQMTPVSSLEILGGVTGALLLIGIVAVALAFLVAVLCGFHSQGPLWLAILVGAMTSLSVIGLGMVVASFTRTVSQAFVVANFPLAMMMFFSGVIYPLPKIVLFTLAGHQVGLYDFLPATHAVIALNKILTLGAGLHEVAYELTALTVLSVLYFGIGVWLFKQYHLRSG